MMELQDESKELWLEEFPEVWARYDMDCGLVEEEEEVRGGRVPFRGEREFPRYQKPVVADILQQLLDEGVVVPGTSFSNSPLDLERKKDGVTWRLLLDCTAMKKVTPKMSLVMPSAEQVVTSLSPRSRYFSVVDLSNCSFAIPLTASSRARFAFTFRGRQYLFTRLPQGFFHTTKIVHQRVARMLSQLPDVDRGWVFSYTDDIIIAGKTPEETEARTRRVLRLIQATGFKAKLRKAQLVQPKVDYLGMTLSARGRQIHPSKLERVRNASVPQNPHQLRQLLGLLVSLQDYVEGFAALVQPLQRLLKEEEPWGLEQQWALQSIVRAVTSAPTLRFPDRSEPFVIRLAVGEEVLGAALLQEDEKGQVVPVCFWSHALKQHEVHYSPKEKGCLAAVRARQAFGALIGSAPIIIQTPQSPWKYLIWGKTKDFFWATPCTMNWTLLLVNRGKAAPKAQPPIDVPLCPAPALRQLPPSVPHGDVWFTAGRRDGSGAFGFAAANLDERWLLGVSQSTVLGAELAAIWELVSEHRSSRPLYVYASSKLVVEGLQSHGCRQGWEGATVDLWQSIVRWVHAHPGVLHIRSSGGDAEEQEWNQKVARRAQRIPAGVKATERQRMWEPSKHEKQEIIAICHMCHEDVEVTLANVWAVASWEGDSEQVARWVQNCWQCAGPQVLPQRVEGPWSRLQLSYIKGLPQTDEGYSSLLVVLDEFSGWVKAYPMWKDDANKAAEILEEDVLRLGMPCSVALGQGELFLRDVVWMLPKTTELVWDPPPKQVLAIGASLKRLAHSAGKHWANRLCLIVAGLMAVHARVPVLGPYQIIFHFPLALRVSPCEGEDAPGPREPLLPWLARLREDEAEYKQRVEDAMCKECAES